MSLYVPYRVSKQKYKGHHKYLLLKDGVPLESPPHPKFGTAESASLYGKLLESNPTEAALIRELANELNGVYV